MKDEDLKRVNEALSALGEHFDSVQIFVNRHESGELGGTVNISKGTGNWFARYGQIASWFAREQAIECHVAVKKSESEE